MIPQLVLQNATAATHYAMHNGLLAAEDGAAEPDRAGVPEAGA
jgi:hypothetical protein